MWSGASLSSSVFQKATNVSHMSEGKRTLPIAAIATHQSSLCPEGQKLGETILLIVEFDFLQNDCGRRNPVVL